MFYIWLAYPERKAFGGSTFDVNDRQFTGVDADPSIQKILGTSLRPQFKSLTHTAIDGSRPQWLEIVVSWIELGIILL